VVPVFRPGLHGAELARCLEPAAAAMSADCARLAELQVDAVVSGFASYAMGAVPVESILDSAVRNVHQLVAAMRAGSPPQRDTLDEVVRARQRTGQGVPATELYDAYRMCLRLLAEEFGRTATEVELDHAAVLAGTQLLWDTADVLTSVLVSARHDVELELARRDESHRVDLLRVLIFDQPVPVEVRRRAAAFGLPLDRTYWAIWAGTSDGGRLDDVRLELDRLTGGPDSCSLLGVIDGDVVGLVSTRPDTALVDVGFPVGVGGPAPLDAVQGAFATASRVHDVARSLDLTGAVHLADLGIKVAVASEPVLGELMVERNLAPLRRDGDFGEAISATLQTYLTCGGRIKVTAHRLGVHPNTVRHRLARFEELTGRRIDDIEVMVEVWWALWWQRCHRGGRRS
jgi:hypothetical protein